MIDRSANIRGALRRRQRGFIINPYRFGVSGGDPYWSSVISLLHCDGTDGSTTITDAKGLMTWSANGNAALSTSVKKFGSASLAMDGTGDYAQSSSTTTPSLSGVSAATIEGFIYPTASKSIMTVFAKRSASTPSREYHVFLSSGKLRVIAWSSSGATIIDITGTTTLALSVWQHVALNISGTAWSLYLDGVQEATGTASGSVGSNSVAFILGRDAFDSSRDFTGYMDEFRFTKGASRYASAFSPPTEAFPSY